MVRTEQKAESKIKGRSTQNGSNQEVRQNKCRKEWNTCCGPTRSHAPNTGSQHEAACWRHVTLN